MVLLVDHDAEGLLLIDHDRASRTFGCVFAADEVALDEHLLFQRGKLLKIGGERVVHLRKGFHLWFDQLQDLQAVVLLCPAGKRMATKIPGQSNPA